MAEFMHKIDKQEKESVTRAQKVGVGRFQRMSYARFYADGRRVLGALAPFGKLHILEPDGRTSCGRLPVTDSRLLTFDWDQGWVQTKHVDCDRCRRRWLDAAVKKASHMIGDPATQEALTLDTRQARRAKDLRIKWVMKKFTPEDMDPEERMALAQGMVKRIVIVRK